MGFGELPVCGFALLLPLPCSAFCMETSPCGSAHRPHSTLLLGPQCCVVVGRGGGKGEHPTAPPSLLLLLQPSISNTPNAVLRGWGLCAAV